MITEILKSINLSIEDYDRLFRGQKDFQSRLAKRTFALAWLKYSGYLSDHEANAMYFKSIVGWGYKNLPPNK